MTPAEYNKCVDLFSDGVYRFILHNLKDRDDSHDVVQDTYEKLWIHHESVNFEKAKSYIFTTAYRTMIDRIRKNKRIEKMEDHHLDMLTNNQEYKGLKKILQEALEKLPEIQRVSIMLRDYEGYSYKEIGDITGLNESQVKVYIYRARLSMKNFIGSLENVI